MEVDNFIEKEEIEIDGIKFCLSSIPALPAKQIYGEIVRATSDVGDIGMTFLPWEVSKKLLEYAAWYNPEAKIWIPLNSETEVSSVFKKHFTLIKLEAAMIRKNFGFLFDGSLQKQLELLRGGDEDIS